MKFIVGKKLDMTQIWKDDKVIAATKVQAGPCVVVQIKTKDKDGYDAVQIGYGGKKEKNIKKPQLGHLKKLKANVRYLREFRLGADDIKDLKSGDIIDVSAFEAGDKIQVIGTSKGRGFQGVVKRHGFHGQDKTHGTKDQLRMPGSIGATGPAHVFKGQRMPGRMGCDRITTSGLKVINIDKENNILFVKGAISGARNGLVLIQGEGELKLKVKSDNNESGIENKELGGDVKNKIDGGSKKVENKKVETENKEVKKDENIEKVVVDAVKKIKENNKE